jgi:riboflavin synthase alpha subunit
VFTGIIQHVGRVVRVAATAPGRRLRIDVGPLAQRLGPGASLAVDGACLTLADLSGGEAELDVVPETLSRTTLGQLRPGERVNLEPALPAGAALDGHIVQGHVDGVAEVARIDRGGGHLLGLAAGRELTDQMVAKGSVALAGVSLTLVDVADGRFSVALVPTTLERTTLVSLRISDRLNVELDIVGKYVRRHLESLTGRTAVTIEQLRQGGFA